jgi:hypothetical protein
MGKAAACRVEETYRFIGSKDPFKTPTSGPPPSIHMQRTAPVTSEQGRGSQVQMGEEVCSQWE